MIAVVAGSTALLAVVAVGPSAAGVPEGSEGVIGGTACSPCGWDIVLVWEGSWCVAV